MSNMDIEGRLRRVKASIPAGVKLVAVSKYHPVEALMAAYSAGQRVFGESREQELSQKAKALPQDIKWHFIGHLQTNKVKYIAPYISLIESVDSLRLLREIDKQAKACGRTIDVLLELHIAEEETKSGLSLDDARLLLSEGQWRELKNVQICGIMMMASNTNDEQRIAKEFDAAADFFDEVKQKYFADDPKFAERSYGMSHDYLLAVRHRSTMVRVGTAIFGSRAY